MDKKIEENVDTKLNDEDLENFLYEYSHKIDLKTLFNRLGLKDIKQGLSEELATNLLERDGPNYVAQVKPKKQDLNLFGGMAIYFWITSATFFSLYTYNVFKFNEAHVEYLIFGFLGLVGVCIYAVFSHVQDSHLKHVQSNFCVRNNIDKLKQVRVVRDGQIKITQSEYLVVGDIIHLDYDENYGNEVPADIRIIEIKDKVKVDNSLLTGDSEPEYIETDFTDDDPVKTRNVIFFKTNLISGSCKGIVIRTGERTLIGRQSKSSQTKEILLEMLSKFVHMWTSACFPAGAENPYD